MHCSSKLLSAALTAKGSSERNQTCRGNGINYLVHLWFHLRGTCFLTIYFQRADRSGRNFGTKDFSMRPIFCHILVPKNQNFRGCHWLLMLKNATWCKSHPVVYGPMEHGSQRKSRLAVVSFTRELHCLKRVDSTLNITSQWQGPDIFISYEYITKKNRSHA